MSAGEHEAAAKDEREINNDDKRVSAQVAKRQLHNMQIAPAVAPPAPVPPQSPTTRIITEMTDIKTQLTAQSTALTQMNDRLTRMEQREHVCCPIL
jgi:hypothetical protein